MAAVVGLADFGSLTLKELKWRWDAVRREQWDHTALLALCIARGPLVKPTLSMFHPFLEPDKPPPPPPENFPQTLTESEIMARWNQAKVKVHG